MQAKQIIQMGTLGALAEFAFLGYGLVMDSWVGEEKQMKQRRFLELGNALAYLAHI